LTKSYTRTLFVGACLLALSWLAQAQNAPADPNSGAAQTPAQTPAPAPAPAPAAPTWSVGPIDFSGLVDGYYTFAFNHPIDGNQLYNFNVKANQFSLNMAKLSMSHSPDPVGFQVDFGFGRAFDIVHGGEPDDAPSFLRNIEQAYVSLKPLKTNGLQLDFGQFVTSAGAEVIESNANWNYSRSILFAWAIPYYHFGLRVTEPIGSHFTTGIQLVNGWNDTEDNNSGKTIGVIANFTGKKVSWNNNYYTGPENAGTNKGFRNLYDTTVIFTPADIFNAYINFDYGQNRNYDVDGTGFTSKWYGIAFASKFQFTSKIALTPRIEWFDDHDGYSTGVAQNLKEFTITYEYRWVEGLLARLEYRHDWSNVDFYERGASPNASKYQDTLTLGIIAFFGPKR
jgi:Putative beta-barrel porin-2, OmpL-like. bbp2